MPDNKIDQTNVSERIFTRRELSGYNGDDNLPYVAYNGIVYDLSDCPRWKSGLHERMHFAGQDLSGEIDEAPHGEEVISRPCVKRVGVLAPN